jgi:hypothetical protein
MEHPDNQRDSEKTRSAIQKPSARNAQIRGLFGSPPKAEDFLATQEAGSGKFGVRIERKCAHLCGLVKQLHRPVGLCSHSRARKNACWKPVASWLQRGSTNSSAITHSLFPFIRLLIQRTKLYDNENCCAKRTPEAAFSGRHCALPGGGLAESKFCAAGNLFCATARSRHQFDALSASKITRGASLKPRISFRTGGTSFHLPREAARSKFLMASHLHLLKISAFRTQDAAWSPGQFLADQDRHTAPVRSSQLSPGGPP